MSSNGSSPEASGSSASPTANTTKKRRLPGACDICKKKKVRCDSGQMPNGRCTNCIQGNLECTHIELTKNLGSAKGYVENLEQRLEKMQRLLNKLVPGIDINQDDESDPEIDIDSLKDTSAIPRNDDEVPDEALTYKMQKLRLDPSNQRYFGKASGFYLLQTALHHKKHYTGTDQYPHFKAVQRPDYWNERPDWALDASPIENVRVGSNFPEGDLMMSLIDLYFRYCNIYYPLLHRPTFEKSVAEGLHLKDYEFAGTVLLVLAIGARWSTDKRVYPDNTDDPMSAGWHFFTQVPVVKVPTLDKPTLYQLQRTVLATLYQQMTITIDYGSWIEVGLAIRLGQMVGCHRKNPSKIPSAEIELWKRVYWVLLILDRGTGSFKGHPSAQVEEEFDLEEPLECDDEYWDLPDPQRSFKQPEGKASVMSFFVYYVKLSHICAYAMRTIYAAKEPRSISGKPWYTSQQEMVSELDSAMNNWLDSLPAHLRWDPNREHEVFFQQSALLYTSYYSLQIFIHKPFIPTPSVTSSLSFPSLTMCTTAARSIANITTLAVEREKQLGILLPQPHAQISVFSATIVLLLGNWSGQRSGMASNQSDMVNVENCLNMFKTWEPRWLSAGRLWDLLNELASAGQRSFGQGHSGLKRSRDEPPPTWNSPVTTVNVNEPRNIAGNQRLNRGLATSSSPTIAMQNYANPSAISSQPSSLDNFNFGLNYAPPATDMSTVGPDWGNLDLMQPSGDLNQKNLDFPTSAFGTVPSDYDTAMWLAAPITFDQQDWGAFINNFAQNWTSYDDDTQMARA
ncbi:putative fungal-specific transcription factor [Mycena floridula]|nr:putative fungal-specific transcription factor [Mycena floridula]